MYIPALATGAVTGALAVILGAFGAHKLKAMVSPEVVATFQTGVTYQFYHSFALLALGIIAANFTGKPVSVAFWGFLIGILFFSGSLYGITICKIIEAKVPSWLGILTPVGGLLLIMGWVGLLMTILAKR